MQMIKPFFGQLRRSYNPAIWNRCRMTSKNTTMLFKIHRIQVRLNQLLISLLSLKSNYIFALILNTLPKL